MIVLVTGATGFLGGWVARELVESGHSVRALVRRPDHLGQLETVGVEMVPGDVLSEPSLAAAVAGVDAIVHCAASVSLRPRDRESLYRTNLLGTRNVLEAAARRRVRVLHTSSIASVGPTSEPQLLDERAPPTELEFDYPYARSKRDSERLALSYASNGQDVVVLNPGIMLGPNDTYFSSTEFVMLYLKSQLGVHLGGGGSFCDVRDVARAYPAALERGRRGERYILAGVNHPYGAVLDELRQLTGLQRSSKLPRPLAELAGLYSELGGRLFRHPFEKYNLAVARWGALFNFCDVTKATKELAYTPRDFSRTLVDTIVDHLRRGAARASTPELRGLLDAANRQDRVMTQRESSRTKRLSRDSGKRPKHASSS